LRFRGQERRREQFSMIGKILTVGGYTLASRLTGFLRDIMLAAMIGAGPVADAFFVAFRLPNHFRAIFAEGAFNAAFIPAYARIRTQDGAAAANQFGDRIFTLLPHRSSCWRWHSYSRPRRSSCWPRVSRVSRSNSRLQFR
jgi:peptidoglycan biosynthesis protein MviN/MurJ (putative lipid II flippase)